MHVCWKFGAKSIFKIFESETANKFFFFFFLPINFQLHEEFNACLLRVYYAPEAFKGIILFSLNCYDNLRVLPQHYVFSTLRLAGNVQAYFQKWQTFRRTL